MMLNHTDQYLYYESFPTLKEITGKRLNPLIENNRSDTDYQFGFRLRHSRVNQMHR